MRAGDNLAENLNKLIIQMVVELHQQIEYLEKLPIIKLLKLAEGVMEYAQVKEEYRKNRTQGN